MHFAFTATLFRWDARDDSSWYFVALPPELSEDIREVPRPTRGFGSVRVRARIGGSEFATSIFPDKGLGTFVLPVKKAVRDAENLADGDTTDVELLVLDV